MTAPLSKLNQGLPFPRRIHAVMALSLGGFVLTVDSSITAVVLPTIAKALDVDGASAVFVVTVYQLILAMTLLPLAALGDRIGHRRLFQIGLAVHTVAALLCISVHSLSALIVVRALQALGVAAAMSTSIGLLRGIYPLHALGKGLAINTIANASGSALAPMIGGQIAALFGWQWVFAAVVPASVLSLLLSFTLPEPEVRKHSFDVIGSALCALTFGLVISGMETAIHSAHLSLSIAILLAGIGVAWYFVRHEKNISNPVLPIDLLAIRAIRWAIISGFSAILAVMILILSLPFRLQHNYGLSPVEVGSVIAAYMVVSSVVSSISGFLSDRFSVSLLSSVGLAIAALGLLFVVYLPANPVHFDLVWPLWICGIGFGLFFSPNIRHIIIAAPANRSAAAGSLNNTVRMLGFAVSASLVAILFALKLGEGAAPALLCVVLTLIAMVISAVTLLSERK